MTKPIDYEQTIDFVITDEERAADQERFDRFVTRPVLLALENSRKMQERLYEESSERELGYLSSLAAIKKAAPVNANKEQLMVGACPACGGTGVRSSPVCASLNLYSNSQCMVCEGK